MSLLSIGFLSGGRIRQVLNACVFRMNYQFASENNQVTLRLRVDKHSQDNRMNISYKHGKNHT